MKAKPTLFRHAAVSIGAGLAGFLLISGVGVFVFVLMPFAERSADDFAALLVHSVRTWAELPPETRPALIEELASQHGVDLEVVDGRVGADIGHHHPYLGSLRAALLRRLGPGSIVEITETQDDRFHAYLPAAGHVLRLSFSADRVDPYPVTTLLLVLLSAFSVALLVASTLAKRIAAPVTALATAARQIGLGERPRKLPETGIRELAVLERVFNETAANLEAERENQQTLIAGISHDLRSPLGRLSMAAGMLAEEISSPLVARIEKDIAAIDGLITAQLELTGARQSEKPATIELGSLLGEIVAAAGEGKREVATRVSASHCMVEAAPSALRRTLANLVENAFQHGGPECIQIVCRRCRNTVFLGVRDRGPGIPKEFRDAVFRPYFRIEPSRSRSTGGSGLGLAIARQFADTHGWRLGVTARVRGGASFWLAIPDRARQASGTFAAASRSTSR